MGTKFPDISDTCHRRTRAEIGQQLFSRCAGLLRAEAFNENIDLGDRETRHADIEIEVNFQETLQLKCENLFIPAGIEGELVIGQRIGPLLLRRHVLKADAGNTVQSDKLGSSQSAMSREDHVLAIDEDRIGESEMADAVGDLPDLFLRMGSRIARVGRQPIRAQEVNVKIDHEIQNFFQMPMARRPRGERCLQQPTMGCHVQLLWGIRLLPCDQHSFIGIAAVITTVDMHLYIDFLSPSYQGVEGYFKGTMEAGEGLAWTFLQGVQLRSASLKHHSNCLNRKMNSLIGPNFAVMKSREFFRQATELAR